MYMDESKYRYNFFSSYERRDYTSFNGTNNIPAIREAIDAIGFICFYNKIHSNTQIIDALILCLGNNFNDNIILWKLVRAFESFNDINVIKTLMEIEQNDSQLVIRNEAKRSLKIINNRTNN